jgi:hypothetical protein
MQSDGRLECARRWQDQSPDFQQEALLTAVRRQR